ncbi:MAG: undecaprenyldiphospho-muramoylpentapeptide beta-N-acetylglucosaminyltransferase [Bdellovibrionota bacterium]
MLRILIAAGASGGHIFPAIAVADRLRSELEAEVVFVGVGKEIERKLIPAAGYRLEEVPFPPFSGSGWRGIVRMLVLLHPAISLARRLFRKERPDVVIGFGGYPAFVPIITAWLTRVPRIVHEQNTQVGIANKFLSLLANRVFAVTGAAGFPKSVAPRVVHLPNPLRETFFQVPDWTPPDPTQPFQLLVLGGSQGAVSLNRAVLTIAPLLMRKNIALLHQTGEQDYENCSQTYERIGYSLATAVRFVDDVAAAYARAHLVISRAGAMSSAEIAASGRPAIFVPLVIAGGHQKQNVLPLLNAGAAMVIDQNDELAEKLGAALEQLMGDMPKLAQMGANARAVAKAGGQNVTVRIAAAVRELTLN